MEKMTQLRIKEIVKEKGITLNELAVRVDITQVSISRIVNGVAKPSLDTLQKIAEALDVHISDLFEDKRPKELGLECPHCHKNIEISIK